jgi:CBS domain-containing protein
MKKEIVKIDVNSSIKNACNLYKDKKIGCLFVIENEDVIGIVTERDIIERTICLDRNPDTTKVREIMSPDVKTVDSNDNINHAISILKDNNIKKLAVTEKDELVGIITVTDIAYTRPDIRRFIQE